MHEYIEIPKSSKSYIPQWYKDAPKWGGENNELKISNYTSNGGMKTCLPFLDALTCGYTIELPCDVQVKIVNGRPIVTWLSFPDPIAVRDHSLAPTLPIPDGCHPDHMTWMTLYAISVPKGYSVLLTHPINRFDLPFITHTGLADGDVCIPGQIPIPFFLKKDFEGIIKKGTPIIQLIPIKRESWISKQNNSLIEKSKKISYIGNTISSGYYKLTRWHKKEYN